MPSASVGTLAKLGTGSTSTVDIPFEFLSETLQKKMAMKPTEGVRGSRSRPIERVRADAYTVMGDLTMNPSPVEIDTLGYYATGTAKSGGNVFVLAETVPDFYVAIDRVAKVPVYAGCRCGKWVLRSGEGRFLESVMSVIGKTETVGAAASFPSLTLNLGPQYIFYDAALTIGGTTYSVKEWEVSLDNGLKPRNMNSQSATDIPPTDRIVKVSLKLPYTSSEVALYDVGNTGAAVVLTLTNGQTSGCSLILSMAKVVFDTESPNVGGRDEILLSLNGQAFKTGSTDEIVITNDSTA